MNDRWLARRVWFAFRFMRAVGYLMVLIVPEAEVRTSIVVTKVVDDEG